NPVALLQSPILHCFLVWIPWLMLAGIGTTYFHAGLLEFSMMIAGLVALGSLYWLLQSLVHWLAFVLFGRRMSRRYIYDYLIINQYPAPQDDTFSAETYFLSVMKNRALDPELRIKAA